MAIATCTPPNVREVADSLHGVAAHLEAASNLIDSCHDLHTVNPTNLASMIHSFASECRRLAKHLDAAAA